MGGHGQTLLEYKNAIERKWRLKKIDNRVGIVGHETLWMKHYG